MGTSRSKKALRMIAASAALVAIIACGGSEEPEEPEGPEGTSSSATASAGTEAAEGATALDALGLEITMPGSARVSELLGKQMVMAGGVVVTVWAAEATDAVTLEAARANSEIFSPTNVQEETLDDGWQITYENEGGAGSNYFLRIRREIGGTAYMCDTMLGSEAARQQAVEACRSLRTAG